MAFPRSRSRPPAPVLSKPSIPRPFVAAHRGLSSEFTENTLAAFKAAVIAGFPALEMDLRVTSDQEVVVLHDAGVERTTNGRGRVADMKYEELRSYPTPDGPVPRLDDVFSSLREWKGLWNLEVKAPKATMETLHLLHHHRLRGRSQISAKDPRVLEAVMEHQPAIPRGYIIETDASVEQLDKAQELGCSWINIDHTLLTPAVATEMRDRGLRIAAWTVNEPDRAMGLAVHGVECFITDTRQVLKAMAGRAEPEPYF